MDTFYVGQLADPLALAAQSAANQCFFTIYFLAAFLPTITAPLVAQAIGEEDWDKAKERICESLFLSNVLGGIFSLVLVAAPQVVLKLVLPSSLTEATATGVKSVLEYAVPYLRWRALGMVPALFSATGFAAYRGLLNTVTPLKVSLTTNLLNLLLDPLCIFGLSGLGIGSKAAGNVVTHSSMVMEGIRNGLGSSGAAAATAFSELTSSIIYTVSSESSSMCSLQLYNVRICLMHPLINGMVYTFSQRLLIRRKLIQWSKLFKPPSLESLLPLMKGM